MVKTNGLWQVVGLSLSCRSDMSSRHFKWHLWHVLAQVAAVNDKPVIALSAPTKLGPDSEDAAALESSAPVEAGTLGAIVRQAAGIGMGLQRHSCHRVVGFF